MFGLLTSGEVGARGTLRKAVTVGFRNLKIWTDNSCVAYSVS